MTLSRKEKWALAAVLLFGITATYLLPLLKPLGTRISMSPVVEVILKDPQTPRHHPTSPNTDSHVTIVVFTDYQCPTCRFGNTALQKVIATDPAIRVLFKDWPIFGEASHHAARLAIAAGYQSRYPAAHDRLMQARAFDDSSLHRELAAAGVDMQQLERDLARHGRAIDALIARNGTQAFSLGLRGTPAYLIGPYLIEGAQDEHELRRAIDKVRQEGSDFQAANI